MATSTISNTVTGVASFLVVARLKPGPGFRTGDSSEVAGRVTATANGSGAWTLALERNTDITPSGSWWEIEEQIPESNGGYRIWAIAVGASDASLLASLVTPGAGVSLPGITQAAADARYAQLSSSPSFIGDVTASSGAALVRIGGIGPGSAGGIKVGTGGDTSWYRRSAANWAANGTYAPASGATGARPTMAVGDVGAQWYDTTLHKTIAWDGTQWRDAAGSVV